MVNVKSGYCFYITGDFAVLLRAGMTVKSALLYNILSSILCFFGMVIGVAIGNLVSADQWIFAAIAGIFLYIALVDMVRPILFIITFHWSISLPEAYTSIFVYF